MPDGRPRAAPRAGRHAAATARGGPRGGDEEGDAATLGGPAAPVLRLAGYEGPLDALLDAARAGRVDLGTLSLATLVDQCVAALVAALRVLPRVPPAPGGEDDAGGGIGLATDGDLPPAPSSLVATTLQRLADWVRMAAWLAELRTRLLLPEDDPQARAAREEADAWRRDLAERAAMHAAADWLDARPQLGRDVFAGGAVADAARTRAGCATVEREALVRALARRVAPGQEQERRPDTVYRPRPPRLWRVPDALARMEQLLGAAPGPEAISGNADLWRFLPDAADLDAADLDAAELDAEDLDAADLAPATGPDPALLCRSAAAGTFVAALELARQGWISLAQEEPLGTIIVRARHEPPPSDPDFETASSVPAAR